MTGGSFRGVSRGWKYWFILFFHARKTYPTSQFSEMQHDDRIVISVSFGHTKVIFVQQKQLHTSWCLLLFWTHWDVKFYHFATCYSIRRVILVSFGLVKVFYFLFFCPTAWFFFLFLHMRFCFVPLRLILMFLSDLTYYKKLDCYSKTP